MKDTFFKKHPTLKLFTSIILVGGMIVVLCIQFQNMLAEHAKDISKIKEKYSIMNTSPKEIAHKNQQIVHAQTEAAGYNDQPLQELYQFTDFRQTGDSIALTHNGAVDPEGLTRLNELLQQQQDNSIIQNYSIVKNYTISSGRIQNLYVSTTVIITLNPPKPKG